MTCRSVCEVHCLLVHIMFLLMHSTVYAGELCCCAGMISVASLLDGLLWQVQGIMVTLTLHHFLAPEHLDMLWAVTEKVTRGGTHFLVGKACRTQLIMGKSPPALHEHVAKSLCEQPNQQAPLLLRCDV